MSFFIKFIITLKINALNFSIKNTDLAGHCWLMPIILATWIRRVTV
jgi:hypothetical protein